MLPFLLLLCLVALWMAHAARSDVANLQERFRFLERELKGLRERVARAPDGEPMGVRPALMVTEALQPQRPAGPGIQEAALGSVPPPMPQSEGSGSVGSGDPGLEGSWRGGHGQALEGIGLAARERGNQGAPAHVPVEFGPDAAESGGRDPGPETHATGASPHPEAPAAGIDWEQFLGAKLFAWVGGVALFLGMAFFVKYSFENNWIPPAARVAMGFVMGLGLLAGGVRLKKKAYAATSQTLCATGVLVLYAVTFACRGYYHFAFFGIIPTLLLMSLITAVAFVLAVAMNAQVIAVLGILGGFLTPLLLSTHQDNPGGLFAYIALLDTGLLAIAVRKRWFYLAPLGAACTAILQIGWAANFFVAGRYFEAGHLWVPMVVFSGFAALFLGGVEWARRQGESSHGLSRPVLGLAGVGIAFAFYFLSCPTIGNRPWALFGYVGILDLIVLALVWVDSRQGAAQPAIGVAVFALLAAWTTIFLKPGLLNAALGIYLCFTLLHAVWPLVSARIRGATSVPWWSQLFPPMALLLTLVPLVHPSGLSFLVWPFILIVDVLAVLLAALSGLLMPILAVLVLTLVLTGAFLMGIPSSLIGFPTFLGMLGFFAIFFMLASLWATRRMAKHMPGLGVLENPAAVAAVLPACSVALPFLLLIMASAKLPLVNPSPVFGLALLLIVLLLGVSRLMSIASLALVGLISTYALERVWEDLLFDPVHAVVPLVWYVVIYGVFSVYPFVFRKHWASRGLPWAAAALAGPLQFDLVYRAIKSAYPNPAMGLLPATFALPALAATLWLARQGAPQDRTGQARLAWFGGVALLFTTLIFPIQFEREWITVGWALEGVALCWLFHRVPHPGLPLVGTGLLLAAFIRLGLNPEVLSYHERGAIPVLNWYLYSYGLVTLCLFAAARLLAPPRNRPWRVSLPELLATLGTVLAFLLVNLEIADFFAAPGTPFVTFQFSGNLARDMSYSIAWALFALLLMGIGIQRKLAPVRYAGIGLLGITLLKLFLHDLARLGQLYRVGALMIVAVIAMVASFLYQRFFAVQRVKAGSSAP